MYEPGAIGAAIQEARKVKDLSLSELARSVGTRHGHISQIENGKIVGGYDLIAKIADALGLSLDRLLGREKYVCACQAKNEAATRLVDGIADDKLPALEEHIRVWASLPDEDQWKYDVIGKVWNGQVKIMGKKPPTNIRRYRRATEEDEAEER